MPTLKSRSADKGERDIVTSQDLRISTLNSRSADKRERAYSQQSGSQDIHIKEQVS